jgi:hypothetical protein
MPVSCLSGAPRHTRRESSGRGFGDASTEEASEQALNPKIVDWTLFTAELEAGVAMLLQAWTPFAEHIVLARSPEDVAALPPA